MSFISLFKRILIVHHTFFFCIKLRSGDWDDQFKDLILLSFFQSFVSFEVYKSALSSWNKYLLVGKCGAKPAAKFHPKCRCILGNLYWCQLRSNYRKYNPKTWQKTYGCLVAPGTLVAILYQLSSKHILVDFNWPQLVICHYKYFFLVFMFGVDISFRFSATVRDIWNHG